MLVYVQYLCLYRRAKDYYLNMMKTFESQNIPINTEKKKHPICKLDKQIIPTDYDVIDPFQEDPLEQNPTRSFYEQILFHLDGRDKEIQAKHFVDHLLKSMTSQESWKFVIYDPTMAKNLSQNEYYNGFILMINGDAVEQNIDRLNYLKEHPSILTARIVVVCLGTLGKSKVSSIFTILKETLVYDVIVVETRDRKDQQRPKRFDGCKLQLVGIDNPPYSIMKSNKKVSNGIEYKVAKEISSYLGFNVTYGSFSSITKYQIITGIEDEFVVHPLTYMPRYYTVEHRWYVPFAGTQPRWSNITRVFTTDIWLCIAALLILNPNTALLQADDEISYNIPRITHMNQTVNFYKFNNIIMTVHKTLYMDKRSHYVSRINEVTQHLVTAGILDRIIGKFLYPKGRKPGRYDRKNLLPEYYTLNLGHLFCGFLFLDIGVSISCVIFVAECVLSKCMRTDATYKVLQCLLFLKRKYANGIVSSPCAKRCVKWFYIILVLTWKSESIFKSDTDNQITKCIVELCKMYFPSDSEIFISLSTVLDESFVRYVQSIKKMKNDSVLQFEKLPRQSPICLLNKKVDDYYDLNPSSLPYLFFQPIVYFSQKCPFRLTGPCKETQAKHFVNKFFQYIIPQQFWKIIVYASTAPYYTGCIQAQYDYNGFILLINEDDVEVDLLRVTYYLEQPSILSAKVIVIYLGTLDASRLSSIFSILNETSVYDVIVVDTGNQTGNVNMYSWELDQCKNMKEIVNLDVCRFGGFNTNISLIAQQRPKRFDGCKLEVVGTHNPPYSIIENDTVVDGMEYKLVKEISSYLGFSIINESFSYITKYQIQTGVEDGYGMHPLTYMPRYYTVEYTWYVPLAESQPRWSSISRVFTVDIWLCVAVLLIAVSFLLDSVLQTWGVLLNIAVKQSHNTLRFRAVFFAWVSFSIIFSNIFQAYMTSYYTGPGRSDQIDSIEKLKESNLTLAIENIDWELSHVSLLNKSAKVFSPGTICPMIFALQNPNIALLQAGDQISYNVPRIKDLNHTINLYKFNNIIMKVHKTLYMDKLSPYVSQVNEVTKRLVTTGTVQKVIQSFLHSNGVKSESYARKNLQIEYHRLKSLYIILVLTQRTEEILFKSDEDVQIARCVAELCKRYFPSESEIFISLSNVLDKGFVWHVKRLKEENDSIIHLPNPPRMIPTCSLNNKIINIYNLDPARMNFLMQREIQNLYEQCSLKLVGPCKETEAKNFVDHLLQYISSQDFWKFIVYSPGMPVVWSCRNEHYDYDGFIALINEDDVEVNMFRFRHLLDQPAILTAKLVVVYLGTLDTSKVKLIFRILNETSVYDVIVVDTGNKTGNVNIYSWELDQCKNFQRVVLLDVCRFGEFNRNISIRDQHRPKRFEGCKLELVGTHNPPYSIIENVTVVDGIEYNLVKEISSYLGLCVTYGPLSYITKYQIQTGVEDEFKILPITYMPRYYTVEYTWYVPLARSQPRWSSITRVFTVDIWFCVAVLLIAVSFLLDSVLKTWGVLLNVAVKQPDCTLRFRAVFFAWLSFSIIFGNVFLAYMTSYYTNPGKSDQIDSIEKLQESNLTLAIENLGWELSHVSLLNKSAKVFPPGTTCPIIFALQNPNIALLLAYDQLSYSIPRIKGLNRTVKFYRFNDIIMKVHKTLYMDKLSPYVSRVNEVTKSLVTTGIVERIIERFLYPNGLKPGSYERKTSQYYRLKMNHLFCGFLFFGFGVCVSIVIFIAECVIFIN
ncbi:hypothetical protein C0J52_13568 [Blattella germanica]|nr:hypothetical protein C0J52_13568 [Blattella germanica]